MSFRDAILAIVLTFVSAQAFSQVIDPTPDRIGIFFDTQGDSQLNWDPPGVPVVAYLIVMAPTFQELYGWEAAIHSTDDEWFVLESNVEGGGTNAGEGQEFIVSYDVPLPTHPVMLLA